MYYIVKCNYFIQENSKPNKRITIYKAQHIFHFKISKQEEINSSPNLNRMTHYCIKVAWVTAMLILITISFQWKVIFEKGTNCEN